MIIENKFDIDFIVYIPSSKKAIRDRGFNQCEYLAEEISKNLSISVCKDIIKNKNIKEQKLLSKEERYKNIKGAFSLKTDKNIKNKKLLLLDDVMTTGSTINTISRLLKENGAEKIYAAVAAVTNKRKEE